MSTRINARIDDELARRVQGLAERSGKSLTEIVSESLARYCAHEEEQGTTWDALSAQGFAACGDGPADLAATYKSRVRRFVARKSR